MHASTGGDATSIAEKAPQHRAAELTTHSIQALPKSIVDEVQVQRGALELVERTVVFLYHGREDKDVVREYHSELVSRGIDSWLDEERLLPGQDWEREIRLAIKRAAVVVVFISRGSASKTGFVQKEIRIALDEADRQPEGAIFLIPALIEECEVPERLASLQYVNLRGPKGLERLLASLYHRLEKYKRDSRPTGRGGAA